ncbi:hypothetical protein pdam_00013701, partial [Pocillopora damicornis]
MTSNRSIEIVQKSTSCENLHAIAPGTMGKGSVGSPESRLEKLEGVPDDTPFKVELYLMNEESFLTVLSSGYLCNSHTTGHPVSLVKYTGLLLSNFLTGHPGQEPCAHLLNTLEIQFIPHVLTPASSMLSVLPTSGRPADAASSTALRLAPVTTISRLPAWVSCVPLGIPSDVPVATSSSPQAWPVTGAVRPHIVLSNRKRRVISKSVDFPYIPGEGYRQSICGLVSFAALSSFFMAGF